MKQTRMILLLFFLFSTMILSQPVQGIRSAQVAGGNANLRIPSCPDPANAFTVEAWVYRMNTPETESIIIKRYKNIPADSLFVYSLSMIRNDPNLPPSLLFKVSDGTLPNIISVNSGAVGIPGFTWTHVAGVFDGSYIRIFINGLEIASQPATISIPPAGEIRMGLNIQPVTNKRFFGFIDEVKFWNIPLTGAQILSGMNGLTSPATIPGLIGYWKFEDDTNVSNIVYDSSSSLSNGDYRAGATTQLFTPFQPQGNSQLSFSPTILDFGSLEMYERVSKNLTITNNSEFTLVGFLAGPFVVTPFGSTSFTLSPSFNNNGEMLPFTIVANTLPRATVIPTSGNLMPIKSFDVNNISMRITRNGRIALPFGLPETGVYVGLEWPKGSGKSCLYQAGLWLGANINGEVYAGIANHNTDYTAGSVVNGNPSDPSNTRFRTYKINRCDNAESNVDYDEWPIDLGAPVNNDGTPKLYGDQTLFTVYNDLDASNHRAVNGLPTLPLGAEVKQLVYGYNRPGTISNNVYLKFIITNRSNQTWTNTYAALWSDIDVGDATDDYAGVDVESNLGYTYNANPNDAIYGSTPPAVSLNYLKGPLTGKPLTNFAYYNNGNPYPARDPNNRYEVYNFLRGSLADGTPYIDPTNGNQTVFPLNGDPVNHTDWVDGILIPPGDRRILISSGPFNLAPGATTELDFAITVSAGNDNINAINVMRSDADIVAQVYQNPPPPAYYIYASSNDKGTISPSGQILVNVGESKTFTFTPNPGYQIKSVTVDDADVGRPNNYTFNNVNECHQLAVLFDDTTPPVMSLKEATVLWPVNHKFSTFILNRMVQSIHDCRNSEILISNARIDSVSCDEPRNTNGDGSTVTDIVISPDCKSVELRSERIGGGNGRVYTIYIGVSDSFGNYATALYKVSVPENQGKGKEAIDDGVAYIIECSCSQNSMSSGQNISRANEEKSLPAKFQLQTYPNPFNPSIHILYSLPEECEVEITVYNTLGQKVESIMSSSKPAGTFVLTWNAASRPSGMYLVRINATSLISNSRFSETKKILFMK